MKLTAGSLHDFLSVLPDYDRLSVADRRALASIERPSQSCSAFVLRESLDALIAAGFLLPASINGRCPIEPSRQEFIRTLRVLRGHPVFRSPGQASFDGYMAAHLTIDEREALRNQANVESRERNGLLYRQVTSSDWVELFLSAKDPQWELRYLPQGAPALLALPEVMSDAQKIVRWFMAHSGCVVLRDLPALAPDPERLSVALHAALRYALLFVSIDPETMNAVLGVWPGITAAPAVAGVPPPRNVTPDETFSSFSLVEDMTAFLVACATEPLRLRSSDGQLFTKTVYSLASTLRPLPQWMGDPGYLNPDYRVEVAVLFAWGFQMVEQKGYPARQMSVSARGHEWLGLSMGDRLRVLMDGISNRRQSVSAFRNFSGTQIALTAPRLDAKTSMKSPPDIPAAIMQPFRSLQGDGFYPVEEIVAFSQLTNPLVEIYRKDRNAYFSSELMYLGRPDAEKLQQIWSATVRGFLRTRLSPLGAVRMGFGKEGLSIAITPAGRYYLGQSTQWEWATVTDSQVIVQPNFEVTFLGEAPVAEAEIGRFAERRGQRIGALFQITKKSIFAAALSGMTAESVLEVLQRVCTREVPANVRREIQGWFGQCRKISFESAIIIRCQDRETALRVIGLAKGFATALNDTVLEYRDLGRQRPWLIKKLKELGVLVEEKAETQPQKRTGYW